MQERGSTRWHIIARVSYHFISYSAVDALDIAMKLAAALEAGAPSIGVWLDKLEKDRHRLRPGEAWDEQIVEGIRACESLVFLLTADSVHPNSVCKNEWTRALKYKKPVIPIRLERGVEMPFRLDPREAIDLDRALDKGFERLRNHLLWLKSPAGVLRTLEERLADADRDLRRAPDEQDRQRILDEMATLKQQIARQRDAVENPGAVAQRIQDSVAEGLEQERQPVPAVVGKARCQVVNLPPGTVPSYFQDRHVETKLLGALIANPAMRLVFVVGRGGVGKTSFTCRLLKAVETGHAFEGTPTPTADAIIYLSSAGARRVTLPNLYADLCRLLPPARAQELMAAYANPVQTTTAKIEALLQEFQGGRVLVLLDNFEDVVDPERLEMRDAELADAVRAILNAPPHAVALVVTTRIAPRDLLIEQPGRQARLELDEGLPSPFAENILREMDVDGKLGLKTASAELLNEARVSTRGYPRALEALFAILSADRDTSLAELLGDTQGLLPENVVRVLVGEAFCRLDLASQQVQQALAVYDRPVLLGAVDHLLQPYLMGLSSAPILGRLVNMQFVRKQEGRYYLHPVDRDYALRRIPRGQPDDRTAEPAVYSQLALFHRGAEYFLAARPAPATWNSLDDLAMQLAEFHMRCNGEDFERAFDVLVTIEFLLEQWGHYRLSRELNGRLEGHLKEPGRRQWVLSRLGAIDSRLGRYLESIRWSEQALAITREMEATEEEGYALYSIGWCHGELGNTEEAVEFSQESLRIAEAAVMSPCRVTRCRFSAGTTASSDWSSNRWSSASVLWICCATRPWSTAWRQRCRTWRACCSTPAGTTKRSSAPERASPWIQPTSPCATGTTVSSRAPAWRSETCQKRVPPQRPAAKPTSRRTTRTCLCCSASSVCVRANGRRPPKRSPPLPHSPPPCCSSRRTSTRSIRKASRSPAWCSAATRRG